MKQTKIYNLNLIDGSDEISPEPLNQNAELLEAALSAQQSAADALGSRLTAEENDRKFAAGTYSGGGSATGDSQDIKLGFTPRIVFVNSLNPGGGPYMGFAATGRSLLESSTNLTLASVITNGFRAYRGKNFSANTSGQTYFYAALR